MSAWIERLFVFFRVRCLSLGQDARLMAGKCALQLLARLWRCVERDKERGMVHWLQHCALVRRDGFERGPIGSAHREELSSTLLSVLRGGLLP